MEKQSHAVAREYALRGFAPESSCLIGVEEGVGNGGATDISLVFRRLSDGVDMGV